MRILPDGQTHMYSTTTNSSLQLTISHAEAPSILIFSRHARRNVILLFPVETPRDDENAHQWVRISHAELTVDRALSAANRDYFLPCLGQRGGPG